MGVKDDEDKPPFKIVRSKDDGKPQRVVPGFIDANIEAHRKLPACECEEPKPVYVGEIWVCRECLGPLPEAVDRDTSIRRIDPETNELTVSKIEVRSTGQVFLDGKLAVCSHCRSDLKISMANLKLWCETCGVTPMEERYTRKRFGSRRRRRPQA